ncbi:AroB-related putative sugar phosphate phospholyase (cyclizing) [Clostridium sp. LP20]|uniref:AroB-related putative sugar phosphate phospholyase (cyclizing) n=1 Tax=Clostridium sp. LP20 TaxID=3418665 RepID=UPI003EE6B9C9
MNIESYLKNYKVNIEEDFNFIDQLKEKQNKLFVIDKNVYNLYKEDLFSDIDKENVYLLDAVEEKKNIETVLKICEKFTQMSAKRNALLIAIGGGIVQDVTGFVSSILYRGIGWIFVPTTLLSACDSCIGSKTSLNYKNYKNLLGTFYPPDELYICTKFFDTLTNIDFNSGLGEVVKFNVMGGEDSIVDIESNIEKLILRDSKTLNKFVKKSLEFKKPFIEDDEFDKGNRIYLNFAHTFGHAFETVSQYKIPHGLAVVLGMLIANRISAQRGILDENIVARIEKICKEILVVKIESEWFDVNLIVDAIRKDKKQTNESLTAVLLYNNFEIGLFNNISDEELRISFKYVQKIIEE